MMLLSFLPLTKTVSKGKSFCDGGEGEEVRHRSSVIDHSHWNGASLQLPKGGVRGPGFCPKSSFKSMAAVRFIIRARASCIWEPRAVFEKNPCCFRPYRVFDHYILAFNSLLLFIDFDNYSGLQKKKKKNRKKNKQTTQQLLPVGRG